MAIIQTQFAPAERADAATLAHEQGLFSGLRWADLVAETAQCYFVILNQQRQVVYHNHLVGSAVGTETPIIGCRPGELLSCQHANEEPGGCGTAVDCRHCGAVAAILRAFDTDALAETHCHLTTSDGTAMDFAVRAVPFSYEDERFVAVSLIDISSEERRHALERIFFHDINNTLMALTGYAQLLETSFESPRQGKYAHAISEAAQVLVEQVQSQRCLLEAEEGHLLVHPEPIDIVGLLSEVTRALRGSSLVGARRVTVQPCEERVWAHSDAVLLRRVIDNMVRNALEASAPGEEVTLSCCRADDGKRMRVMVHNPAVMTEAVRSQVFTRHFSTKGSGRGLGTYGMRLLSERYLHGRVWCTSAEGEGTTFTVELPVTH